MLMLVKRFCFSSRRLECKQIFQVFVFLGMSVFFSFYNRLTPVLQKKRQQLVYQTKIMFCTASISSHLISSLSGRHISLQRQQQHNTTLGS